MMSAMKWTQMTLVPRAPGGDGAPIVHAGRLVWFRSDGSLAYDPRENTWSQLDPSPAWRDGAVVCSAGDDLLVFGGLRPGERIDPTGASHPMSKSKQPSVRKRARYAWTGRELLVWGGEHQNTLRLNGGAYDPARDVWRTLAKKDAATTSNGRHVWTGNEFWIWGGGAKQRGRWQPFTAGFAYDPTADSWRALADLPGQPDHSPNLARIADAVLLVKLEDTSDDKPICSAWRYEARADLWEPCTSPPEVAGFPQLIDCGDRVVLMRGQMAFEYVIARDTWEQLPELRYEPHRLLCLDGALLAFDGEGSIDRLVLP